MYQTILLALFLINNISFCQLDEEFLNEFLLQNELNIENKLTTYNQFDFSHLWLKTANKNVLGIIGEDHQRIEIKLISITKNSNNPNEYLVKGKSKIKQTICDFEGRIELKKVKEVKQIEFGVDDEYAKSGIKAQGVLIGDYEFKENKNQKHSGVFKGQFYSKWYLDGENQIKYDNILSIADGYSNNAFVGV